MTDKQVTAIARKVIEEALSALRSDMMTMVSIYKARNVARPEAIKREEIRATAEFQQMELDSQKVELSPDTIEYIDDITSALVKGSPVSISGFDHYDPREPATVRRYFEAMLVNTLHTQTLAYLMKLRRALTGEKN